MKLILIRHGETDWNRDGKIQGKVDVPLNAHGIAQADRMAKEMAERMPLDAIYASDLSRARHTAEALAAAAQVTNLHFDPRLREVDQGDWEGMVFTEIRRQYPELVARRRADPWNVSTPGGESARQVHERVSAAIREIAERHPGGTVAVVAHGFVLALVRIWLSGEPIGRVWELIPNNCDPLLVEWTAEIK